MKQNFRTIGSLVAICAMTVLAASCKKEYLPEEATEHIIGVERHITTSASLPQTADKAYLDETDGRKVKWEYGDAINVNGTNLSLTSIRSDATSATFEGTTYAIPSGGNEIYWAVYPTTLAGTYTSSIPSNFTANRLTFTLPDVQTFDLSQTKILEDATYMAAKASVPAGQTRLNFSMKNLCAVMKIHLSATGVSNTNVERIVFSSASRMNGEFYFDGSAVTASTASTCNQLTVNLTDGTHSYIDIAGGVDVYAILPPISSSKLSMTIYNTDGDIVTKTATTATLASNNIYTNTLNITAFTTPVHSFTVNSSGKKVLFAPGNLQWSATNGGATATTHVVAGGGTAAGTWRFAENQWDAIGTAAGNSTAMANRATQAAWIDLFGWGTSGYDNTANDPYAIYFQPWSRNRTDVNYANNRYGYGPSKNMTDPSLVGTSANYDWGVYNAIYNPKTNTTDPAGTWRTPTQLEWRYILLSRGTCSGVRYARATVNNVPGLIIVPDNWNVNIYALSNTNIINAAYTDNIISSTEWTNIFEPAGCVFLPVTGNEAGNGVLCWVIDASWRGYYWSSSVCWERDSYSLEFEGDRLVVNFENFRSTGLAVRLVKDVQ